MEFIIPQKVTICLNMIVKNESHIIENTLEKLCNKIKFDYWVICDTGSTDNTPEIITDFFSKKDIKGELHYDAWENFAHNRTLALKRAYKKTDLLLVFDADDEIVGDIKIPTDVLFDEYSLKFGSSSGTSYTRVLMINNHKIFEYLSVIHEFISCKEGPTKGLLIEGDYYVVSGRKGSRSFDQDKYLKDALVLEKAYAEAITQKDPLFNRYAFYCANSYKDCGKFEDAIKWYKITLNHEHQWGQEKYISCLYIYECFEKLKQPETGFFYLVKAFAYDNERVECLYPLLVHYCCENMHKVAYNYYLNIKDFFENKYLNTNISAKLFSTLDKFNFFVPYYMILIADKVQDFYCVVKMYEIIFTKKQRMFEEWYIKNLLYNLQFFLQHVPKDNTQFIPLANEYFKFVFENGIELQKFDFLSTPEYKNAGIIMDNYIIKEVTNKTQKYSKNECANSKNILIYTGFSDIDWNYTYMQNNALGGSEKAVAYLSKCFPKDYNIFISGHVKNETIGNIQYIHLNELTNLIEKTPFHTVIVSRYIGFYEMFKTSSFYQSFIWAHDTLLLPYGCNLNETHILKKWNNYIDGCVCLTEWHKTIFSDKYPELKNKITLINNGLELSSFPNVDSKNILKSNKIKNKFIYTSRPDRGLNILLKLWPQIIEKIPDATLTISTYGSFPSNAEEFTMKTLIDATPSIHYLGKLNVEQLYNEMNTAEFWLYPTHWQETSCITALEMLMSEVICLYYPVAGLVNTVGDYGIQIKPGSEIDAIVSLTDFKKCELRQNGREYAETCSWENRFTKWVSVLRLNKQKWYFYCSPNFETKMVQQYIDNLNNIYPDYCIYLTKNKNTILAELPAKITFVYEVFDKSIFEQLPNTDFSLLNTEPLNIPYRLQSVKNIQKLYNGLGLGYYDYSKSNFHILNENGIDFKYKTYLPYICSSSELLQLQKVNENTEKVFDFGILKASGGYISPRRQKIINFLKNNHFSVNIIEGWHDDRDNELAKCKIILNIHGNLNDDVSMIFEHLRCDRLLAAGYKILSEYCLYLDEEFINKNKEKLKVINYDEFFNINTYNNLEWLKLLLNKDNDILQMKIFIIHYKKLTERKQSILSQFKKYNISNYEFIEIDRDELHQHNTDIFDKNFGNALTAISLSHYFAYKKIIEKYDNAIIFEDDVILHDDFINILKKYLIELPSDYDALFIGNGCNLHVATSNLRENKHIYKRALYYKEGILADNGLTRCADSYIISKKCCIKLYDYINNLQNKINESIDAWLEIALMKNNCNVYWAEPTIVTQGSQNGEFDRSWYVLDNNNGKLQNFIKYLQKNENSTFLTNIIIKDVSKISESLRFYYGTNEHQIDVTSNVIEKCIIDNEIFIPGHCNERAALFTDPLFGVIKNVYVVNNNKYCILSDNTYTCINISNKNNSYCRDSIEPNLLTCYKCPYEKIRVGKDFDGGYVICNIPDVKYDFLLSCGVADDISFEEEFCNIYTNAQCTAYDGTVLGINITNQNITFVKKNINTFNDNNNTNLHSDIENNNNIFLKMDIEGYEIPWINTLNYKQLDKFSQIVIEFHFPFSYKEVPIFNKLNKNHVLVHFHANNCCGVRRHKGILMPNVFECTYIHKKYYTSEYLLNDEEIPSSLDMQNVRENSEIYLNYEPFVFKNKNMDRVTLLNNDINTDFKRKNICFIHSCYLKDKKLKRLDYLIDKIKNTGLINHLEAIYINNIGIPIKENIYGNKFNICNYSDNPQLYEIPTINKIHQFSKENTNCNILYLHTKGISYDDNDKKENDWIDMMLYFLVEKFELCLEKLQHGIQAVGCSYNYKNNPAHFSGNFWWSESQYISKLPSLIEKTENVNPNDAEFWLCKNNPSIYELHNSIISHYQNEYPKENYRINYELAIQSKSEIVINKLSNTYSSAWLGHMKFAFFIVSLLKPSVIVDLGVDFGHSTFSFASAQQGIVFGIDSFEGDIQAGIKNTLNIVNELKNDFVLQELLINNIKFIKGYFDDIFNHFDQTIDILHIDGLHTIEAVSNDYNKWITKTSNNAVILFHDVMSYPDSVGKVFNDIQYPKFYFTHSAGLGVVCKTQKLLNLILSNTEVPNKDYIIYNKPKDTEKLKIIDCFIFYNELDLLTYRLNILNDVVDYFVLVESTHTFVGKEKPLFYQENKHLFDKFNHKIIHIIVDDFSHKYPNIDFEKHEQWNNEKFQRNCISRGINKLKLNECDIITVTDLDEIPNPELFEKIKANKVVIDINTIELDFYYYNLNCKMDHHFYLSKMMSYKKYKELSFTFEQIRQNMSFKIINNGGWHLSYFGDKNFIKNKIENFSHQELNLELFTNQEKIQNRIKNKQDLFDRDIKICHINIEDNHNLPPSYDVYLKNYYRNGANNMNNYKYTQKWFLGSEIKNSLDKFLDQSKENNILEIGCFEGLSSVFFADNFLDNQKSSLTCVDPFLTINNNDHSQFLQNNEEMNFDFNISICENSDRITKHKITSDYFFENNNQTYNFIYIDGCHEPDFIKRDMENSFNILEKNGIMWMDDYGGGDGIQIKNTMDKFLEKYTEKYELIHRGYQLAIRKR